MLILFFPFAYSPYSRRREERARVAPTVKPEQQPSGEGTKTANPSVTPAASTTSYIM